MLETVHGALTLPFPLDRQIFNERPHGYSRSLFNVPADHWYQHNQRGRPGQNGETDVSRIDSSNGTLSQRFVSGVLFLVTGFLFYEPVGGPQSLGTHDLADESERC